MLTPKQYIKLKDGVNVEDFLFFNPKLMAMVAYINMWCAMRGVDLVISSAYRPPGDGISKSTTHQTYRAVDISVKAEHGWTVDLQRDFLQDVMKDLSHIGAISSETKKPRPVYFHGKGENYHCHVQSRR